MIEISPNELALATVFVVVLISIVQWLLAIWIKARLEKSIQHEYDRKIEGYRFSQIQRQKAELVADLFSEWTKYYGKEDQLLEKKELIEYWKKLNAMSLQISLWVPDAQLLKEIMSRLQMKDNAKDVRALMGDIRKLILGDKEDNFDAKEITLWPRDGGNNTIFEK